MPPTTSVNLWVLIFSKTITGDYTLTNNIITIPGGATVKTVTFTNIN